MVNLVTSGWSAYINDHMGEPLEGQPQYKYVVKGTIHGLTTEMERQGITLGEPRIASSTGPDADRLILELKLPNFLGGAYYDGANSQERYHVVLDYIIVDLLPSTSRKIAIRFNNEIIARIDNLRIIS